MEISVPEVNYVIPGVPAAVRMKEAVHKLHGCNPLVRF